MKWSARSLQRSPTRSLEHIEDQLKKYYEAKPTNTWRSRWQGPTRIEETPTKSLEKGDINNETCDGFLDNLNTYTIDDQHTKN
jgi:hypothetical protein